MAKSEIEKFIKPKLWGSYNGKPGIYNIELAKSFLLYSIKITAEGKISFPDFHHFNIFMKKQSTDGRMELKRLAELNSFDFKEVEEELEEQLKIRGYYAFLGESIPFRAYDLIPETEIKLTKREDDFNKAVDAYLGFRDLIQAAQIKSHSFMDKPSVLEEERKKYKDSKEPYPYFHLFYKFYKNDFYLITENGDKFRFPDMTVDLKELEDFFLEKVFK